MHFFFPRPAAYDNSTLLTLFSPGRWTQNGAGPPNILPYTLSPCNPKSQGIMTTSELLDFWTSNTIKTQKAWENPGVSWRDPDPWELHSCSITVLLMWSVNLVYNGCLCRKVGT